MNGTRTKLNTVREYDIRPRDFQSGKRLAVVPEMMHECGCCGRKIVHVYVLENGVEVGSECQGVISIPVYRIGRKLNTKQAEFFRINEIQWEVA